MLSRRWLLIPVALLALAPGCGDGSDAASRGAKLARTDSAGIQILTPRSPVWDSGSGWRVPPDPVAVIGATDAAEGDPTQELYNVWSAYRREDGSLVIGNGGTFNVRLFDRRGKFIREFGRRGGGPGEFQDVNSVFAWRGDSIGVFDGVALRTTLYDASGRFGRVVSMPGARRPLELFDVLSDSRMVAILPEMEAYTTPGPRPRRQDGAVTVGFIGEKQDTIGRIYVQMVGLGEEHRDYFPPYGSIAVCGDEYVEYRTDRYEMRAHDFSGTLLRIIRPAIEPEPFTAELFEQWKRDYMKDMTGSSEGGGRMQPALVEKNRRMLAGALQPSVIPPINWLTCDRDGNAWVREYPPRGVRSPEVRYSVFTTAGEWLGRVNMPYNTSIIEIGSDYILAKDRDADGAELVKVYALEK
ncbi:MAG TPA: hypothetical protein VF035_07370 [Longimicrobiales bacterium]